MAVVVTVAKGFDLGYIWKTQGQASAERSTGGYYINAAQAGEPPGRWWGPGAQALGFTSWQAVERKPYDALYQQREPRTGAKLGRARGRYATFADHLAQLKAAEPHATAERVIELEREAVQATRQPAAYTDVTVSFSKSISVLHASIRENARRARLAGDGRALAYWSGREERFQEVLHRANRAALEYLQEWAGVTRTGYHGVRAAGQEPGRFEEAGLVVTSWLQGTSRDGDPQDYIHNQVARITRTVRDGKGRAPDTASLRAVLGALQGVAGTGKTWVLAAAARAWGGPVFGTATSQNATNELRRAGVRVVANTTRLLADLAAIPPGSLIEVDEGSMVSLAHLAALVEHAARNGCKLVLAGDQEQLAAVEGGGAMMLLADRLGYVQLAEPVRFKAGWEREASLRLRRGDASALDEYDRHGRIRGAPPEQAMDQAVHAYVASYLAGRDVLLMAADWARCRELSTRIREDLIHLGLVDATRAVRIAEGARASVGDLIICRRNDHRLEAGEAGRALANGDILRIEAITGSGLMVRRLLGADPATGQRRFTDRAFCYVGYQSSDLAYAITGHSAQGATVHTGIALVTGNEGRQWLYPAMTRGTDANLAFVFTTPPKVADPRPGTRAAPELERYERIRREREGFLSTQPAAGPGNLDPREPIAVLADVLGRDGCELSASEIRRRNLANADHLGVLNTIWVAETRGARDDRYRELVIAALPADHRQPLSHQSRWLFRTLHAAELAGLDPAEVTRAAIASRDLAGARDIASVVDARIRQRVDPLLPQPQGPWAERVPQLPDPERRAYLAEIAAMMDGRKQRLGQHAAQIAPAWAITALGPVPDDAAVRQEWERKASLIAAYREMYGYDDPGDPIGPEPTRDTPDHRAAWHEAFLALSQAPSRRRPYTRQPPISGYLIRTRYHQPTSNSIQPIRQAITHVGAHVIPQV